MGTSAGVFSEGRFFLDQLCTKEPLWVLIRKWRKSVFQPENYVLAAQYTHQIKDNSSTVTLEMDNVNQQSNCETEIPVCSQEAAEDKEKKVGHVLWPKKSLPLSCFLDPQEEWNVFNKLSSELTFTIINTKIGLSVADN